VAVTFILFFNVASYQTKSETSDILRFKGEELLATRPTPKLEDHPMSAVWDCPFYIFTATLHTWRPFLRPQPEDAPLR
jgi:hypothetical protein